LTSGLKFILKISFILFLTCPIYGHGQIYKSDIPAKFERIKYFTDSTVSIISCTKKDVLQGYSIEFNENGNPSGIGKYKNGKRKGKWTYHDGTIVLHRNKGRKKYAPPFCGTITMDPNFNKRFHHLYARLMKKKS
jgi:hypothetical protein